MKYQQCEDCLNHVAGKILLADLGLTVLKAMAGILGQSRALIADAAHSMIDVITAAITHITLKISGKPPDEQYPYGYGHIEFVSACLIGFFIISMAILICATAIMAMVKGNIPEPGIIAILGTLLSIAVNRTISRYGICVGKETGSPVIMAIALENRADMLTSYAVFMGILGAKLGIRIFDPLGAVLVSVIIGRTGIKVLYGAIGGLMDTSLERNQQEDICQLASSVEGVKGIIGLKTRRSGQSIWIDLEVAVDQRLDLNQTKLIIGRIKESIRQGIEHVGNVRVLFRPVLEPVGAKRLTGS